MAQRSVGTLFKIGAVGVAELTEIGGLDLSADTIDSTALDSVGGYKQFIGGFKDAGEVSLSGFFNPGDGGQMALYNALQNGTVDAYQIIFPATMGAQWNFSGVVTAFSTGAQLEDAISFEATVKVSGQPTLGVTASANLTALAVAGFTLSPVFAGGTYYYYATGSATSFTVTATLAGATFDIYVNGSIFQKGVASGSASSAITGVLSAVGNTADILVIYNESGKTSKAYEIILHKNA